MADQDVVLEEEEQVTSTFLGPEAQGCGISESEVAWLQGHFHIPPEYELSLPRPEDRVVNPPDGRLAVYQETLWGGLRFPIPDFVVGVFKFYRVVPAQLTPNSIRVMTAFLVLCHLQNVRPRISLFRAFFVLKRNPKIDGWWLFGFRPKRTLFKGLPSSIHGWRDKFFFLGVHSGWGFPTSWREPYTDPNRNDVVEDADRNDFRVLLGSAVSKISDLLTEQNLFGAGLSPTDSLGGPDMRKPGAEEVRRAVRKTSKKRQAGEGTSALAPAPKRLQIGSAAGSTSASETIREWRQIDSAAGGLVEGADVTPVEGPSFELLAGASTSFPAQETSAEHRLPEPLSPPRPPIPASGAASVPAPVGTSVPGPSRPPSSGGDPDEESPECISALEDPKTAVALFRRILLPVDVEMIMGCSMAEITGSTFTALAGLVHANLWMTQRLNNDGRLRASLEGRIEEITSGKKAVEEQLAATEERIKRLVEEKAAAEARAETSLGEVILQTQRVSELEGDLATAKADLDDELNARMSLQVEVAEKKAEVDRGNKELNEAASKSLKQAALIQSLSNRLATAAQETEAAKTGAIEAFKSSPHFTEFVAECSADSYRLGFADCKEAVSKLFPDLDFSKAQPPGDEESSEAEEEAVERDVAGFVDDMIEALRADEGDVPVGSAPSATPPIEVPAQSEESPGEACVLLDGRGTSTGQAPFDCNI